MDNSLLKTSLGRFRLISIIEGISYILLLFVAMPLKYMFDMPLAVRVVGSLHGALFIAYMFMLLQVIMERKWGVVKAGIAFIASLIPFGTFIYDAQLKKEQESL